MNTIAAISTPDAAGGIAMIRISGEDAIRIADEIFTASNHIKVTEMRGYSCAYGTVSDGQEILDDVVLTVFRAPHSYTGEDTVEITCHGGIYLTKRMLLTVYLHGAEPAGPGEFTKRAFLNGKLTLSQAEAVMDLIQADGAAALRTAQYAKDGRLGREMHAISDELVDLMSALAYWLDDAEECPPELERTALTSQLNDIYTKLREMSLRYQDGMVLRNGIRSVLLGKPNAGKSSVMNWLCGTNRSIVTEIAGTTRDVITEQVKIGEFTLLLSDTAGLRETDNAIESIGISQAYQALDTADLVLYVVDANAGMTDEDADLIEKCAGHPLIMIWNKTDLSDAPPPELQIPVVQIAAIFEKTTDQLADVLKDLFLHSGAASGAVPLNERQNLLIVRAAEAVAAGIEIADSGSELDMMYADLETAAGYLREIEGENITEDVIDGVFSKFCVGK
ncbi:MAG: tRNA uridine-5-carboxymethylaminomethyl(34) synthesis GTPase MnmE [Oscillospiraceae bacterium]|nr:tRNA uridine-5-carboxymethylaminomethyl(34) synthesis GTPase MnmE [Oscillospiraceae bacterium]